MAGATLKSDGLLVVTAKETVSLEGSPGPGLMLVIKFGTVTLPLVPAAISLTVCVAPTVKVGGWLTKFTSIAKLWAALVSTPPLVVPPLFIATTVILAVPETSGFKV